MGICPEIIIYNFDQNYQQHFIKSYLLGFACRLTGYQLFWNEFLPRRKKMYVVFKLAKKFMLNARFHWGNNHGKNQIQCFSMNMTSLTYKVNQTCTFCPSNLAMLV